MKFFKNQAGLSEICTALLDQKRPKGRAYVFGGLYQLIRAYKGGNWRQVVTQYIQVIGDFAKSLPSNCQAPVIVLLPWRDDSHGLFREKHEIVS